MKVFRKRTKHTIAHTLARGERVFHKRVATQSASNPRLSQAEHIAARLLADNERGSKKPKPITLRQLNWQNPEN